MTGFIGLVDLRELHGVPIRSQFMLGKWLFGNKQRFARIAVFGGRAWEMRLARAIMTIAGMDRVGFFNTEAEATGWLKGQHAK